MPDAVVGAGPREPAPARPSAWPGRRIAADRRPARARPWWAVLAVIVLCLGPPAVPRAFARAVPEGRTAIEQALPPLADPDSIATTLTTRLRVFRLARKPRVLVLDFPSRYAQSAALDRVAALIEFAGAPRNRVVDAGLMASLLDHHTRPSGHDYSARSLARFFTLAGALISDDERRIRALAVANGLIRPADGGYVADRGPGALLSIARMDGRVGGMRRAEISLRKTILAHEVAHGWFFVDGAYRTACLLFWRTVLTGEDRATIRQTLASLGYDAENETLMVNEAQAYLGFTRTGYLPRRHMGLTADRFTALRADLRARLARLLP